MKTDIEHKGMWWSWVETCDICGRVIQDKTAESSAEPDIKGIDLCVDCMHRLMFGKHKMSYKQLEQYLKENGAVKDLYSILYEE